MRAGDRMWLATGVGIVLWFGYIVGGNSTVFGMALGSNIWWLMTMLMAVFKKD